MADDDMVERVARAIYGRDDAAWKRNRNTLGVEQAFHEARAAITAMREPTEAMVEASNREWDGRMSHRSSGAWQAMIDTALASRPHPKPRG